ncbi:MAG: 30S ribosome-binding factor RbfA [Deltaproteobacteria bacterium]|nr:30S ribosome-binding factor RbfA [Deltaproteobacteria bacterium]MBW2020210.1 30S ribosome-binding factor RbfA [Deltaproteobacteria bacterium]MBW2075109.1 30S ribosome-binding factor RbfA [Deltaproteobacteria bacterium]RLB81506.1 MAG: 30S ribosome-binding factor RbfA [Deltaproteobacteria bacterium]
MIRFKRADRVGGQVKKELSDLLLKEIRDPRLDSVTIIRVSITDDLRSARIYFSVAEGKERKLSALAGFKSAVGYLRRELSHRLELRYMPELQFFYDESIDQAAKLNEVLKTLHNGNQATDSK